MSRNDTVRHARMSAARSLAKLLAIANDCAFIQQRSTIIRLSPIDNQPCPLREETDELKMMTSQAWSGLDQHVYNFTGTAVRRNWREARAGASASTHLPPPVTTNCAPVS